ncbi:MAG: 2-C-methyl-D-erythritol 2,4-cyclodiphosphate synthase [Candidatus Marinimicrobia bacterium]|nr:2-C-methyl-D-erythritol 2,4-cyclodiphosphate synthase [Candidatus Neomarinimicrobiota bacterium]
MIKTGIGYDVHQLADGQRLIIGGVEISSNFGSIGHSDGDVLLHAIVDALLGAAAMGDIGLLFPSEDQQWKDADSRIFLKTAMTKIRAAGYLINNVDGIVILQQPKLRNYIQQMRQVIASILGVNIEVISVKATTTDHLGFIGESKGIGAMAVVTLNQ